MNVMQGKIQRPMLSQRKAKIAAEDLQKALRRRIRSGDRGVEALPLQFSANRPITVRTCTGAEPSDSCTKHPMDGDMRFYRCLREFALSLQTAKFKAQLVSQRGEIYDHGAVEGLNISMMDSRF